MRTSVLYLLILLASCKVPELDKAFFQPIPIDAKPPHKSVTTEPAHIFYRKSFRFTNDPKQLRFTEAIFYGKQQDLKTAFVTLNPQKPLSIDAFTKFPTATFFTEQQVEIPDSSRALAEKAYAPLLQKIFSSGSDTIEAEIMVLGYCDESVIAYSARSYHALLEKTGKDFLQRDECRNYLAYLRAKEIGHLLSDMIAARQQELTSYRKVHIDIFSEGRGLQFPEKGRQYQPIDPKRRIAKVYYRIRS